LVVVVFAVQFERFLPTIGSVVSSVYAPIMFPPAGVLVLQHTAHGQNTVHTTQLQLRSVAFIPPKSRVEIRFKLLHFWGQVPHTFGLKPPPWVLCYGCWLPSEK